jgi:hypothetical protein
MTHLAYMLLDGAGEVFWGNFGMWGFLAVGAVALFGVFLPIASWSDSQRREREAYYKAETMRRLAESSGESGKAAIELLREQNRLEWMKKREGLKIGGLITIAVGIGLGAFLYSVGNPSDHGAFMVGLIPALIGVAMLAYVFISAGPTSQA